MALGGRNTPFDLPGLSGGYCSPLIGLMLYPAVIVATGNRYSILSNEYNKLNIEKGVSFILAVRQY